MSRPRGRFARSKVRQGDSLRHFPLPALPLPPHGIYIDRCISGENKVKKRNIFEIVWGLKMSVEGGCDRQQTGFLIIAAVGFPHGNVGFCQTFI